MPKENDMAKQESKTEVHKGATKVASGIAKVFDTVAKQGNILTQCVTSVKSVYRGADVPVADERFIADNVARIRNWSKASEGPRKSEVRKIVRNYALIPEAMQLYQRKHDTFTWHTAMKLVTKLNAGNTPKQAVAAMVATASASAPKPMAVFAAAIARIVNLDTRSPKVIAFRKDLAKLLDKHNLA